MRENQPSRYVEQGIASDQMERSRDEGSDAFRPSVHQEMHFRWKTRGEEMVIAEDRRGEPC